MNGEHSVWNSLEIVKLIVSVMTPMTIVFLGYLVNRMVQRLEQARWANQKVIEKRILVFDKVAPLFNDIYCYFRYIGNWKKLSPVDIIEAKRTLDKEMHINSPLFSHEFMDLYRQFRDLCFRPFSGVGKDAKLRASIDSADGNRRKVFGAEWSEEWDKMFADPGENSDDIQLKRDEHQEKIYLIYNKLTNKFSQELGVGLND